MAVCWFTGVLLIHVYLHIVSGVSITITPTTINIGGDSPTTSLTIRCSPNNSAITTLLSLQLVQKDQFGNNQFRVTDVRGKPDDLQITMTDLSCSDATSYYCISTYLPNGSSEAVSNVSARTYPRNIEMDVFPNRVQYSVGEQVEFNCNGEVGNVFTDAKSLWVWEWRYVGTQVTGWTTYPYSQNVTYEKPTTADNCQYSSRSILRHYLGTTDNEIQFRCYVGSPEVGGNKTVSFQASSTDGTAGATGTANLSFASGMGVGLVITLLIAGFRF